MNTWFRTENIYWKRLLFVAGLSALVWTGLMHFIPPNIFEHVAIVLAVVQGAINFVMHSGAEVK